MNKLIEFNVPGGTVVVESEAIATANTVRGAGVAQVTETVGKSLEDALSVIRHVAEATVDACEGLAVAPDTVEVQFGLKFNAELNAYIAKSKGEATLNVTLVWTPD